MKEKIWQIVTDRRFHRWLGVVTLLVFLTGLALWRSGWDVADGVKALQAGREFCSDRPWWLFLALVILPGVPFPSSALFMMAGAVWGDQPWRACGYGLAALVLNQAWTYALAAGPAHGLVARMISRVGWKIPIVRSENMTDTLLVLRLVPGVPLFVQNYLLGLLRVPYGRYAWVSLVCTGPMISGFILAGAGIADGRWKIVLIGVALLVLATVGVRVFRRKKCRVRSAE